MKKIVLATFIILACHSAFAADSAVMKLQGKLTNASCEPNIGNGGVVDYGTIRLGELSSTANNVLGTKSVPISITCNAPTQIGYTMQDNRSSSDAHLPVDIDTLKGTTQSYVTFGVGNTAGGVKIGTYGMWMEDVTTDGNTADPIVHNSDWPAGTWSFKTFPRSDAFSIQSFAAPGKTTPLAITTATFNMIINLVIDSTADLAITDDTAIDGQSTLTLVYL